MSFEFGLAEALKEVATVIIKHFWFNYIHAFDGSFSIIHFVVLLLNNAAKVEKKNETKKYNQAKNDMRKKTLQIVCLYQKKALPLQT